MKEKTAIIPFERIATVIHLIRGQKVMLDRDLALLYGVETRVLNQAVRRNYNRFPPDFMLTLAREAIRNISQIVICSDIESIADQAIRDLWLEISSKARESIKQVRI